VFIKDATGALDSVSATITNMLEPPLATMSSFFTLGPGCLGTVPSITLTATGGLPPYQYSCDMVNFQSSPTFTNCHWGNYFWCVKDANGCIAQTYTNIISGPGCNMSWGGGMTSYVCEGTGVFDIEGNQGVSPYMYAIDGGPYQVSGHFEGLGPGLHTFKVKDATGAEIINCWAIRSLCELIKSVVVANATCGLADGSIIIAADNGVAPYQYSIDGFNFQSTGIFTNLPPDNYAVMVKDFTGKVAYRVVQLLKNCPVVTATTGSVNCSRNNGSIEANGSGGKTPYTYSIDGTTFQTSPLFLNLAAAAYTVTIKDSLGFKDSVIVTVPSGGCFTVYEEHTDALCGQTGSITASYIGGTAPVWYSLNGRNYQPGSTFPDLTAGNYILYAKTSNNIIDSIAVIIKGSSKPVFSLGRDTFYCIGGTTRLLPDSIYTGVVYSWNTGETTRSIAVTRSGNYSLTITDTNYCEWADTISISFKNLPEFNLGNDTSICEKDSIALNARAFNAIAYVWNTGAPNATIIITQPGIYWCEATEDGCTYRDSITIAQKPRPVVNLGADTTLCEGATLQLNALNTNAAYTWQDNSTSAIYTVNKQGIYHVIVNEDGCIAKDTIDITYLRKPSFDLGDDQQLCAGMQVVLKPAVQPGWQLLWQDGSSSPSFTVTKGGLYSLEANNDCGSMKDEVLFTEALCDIYIPTAFSPGGNNKLFRVSGIDLITWFHLQIFNRYGQLVFETMDKNKGWDGAYMNKEQPAGGYVWILDYQTNKRKQTLKGSLVLVR